MGRAMLAGLVRGRPDLGPAAVVADVIEGAARDAAAEVGGRVGAVADAAGCDLVVLAVKPKDVPGALAAVSSAPGERVLLSVAAGWPIERLAEHAGGVPLVRTMPNLAVRHGQGVVGIASRGLDDARAVEIMGLLEPLGTVVAVAESQFPAITALAGSGPGFAALFAEALEEGAVGAGLDRAGARQIARAVLGGTAALLAEDGDPALLRQRVSSPGGTTMAGLAVLERGAVRGHIADAVRAAAARAAEL